MRFIGKGKRLEENTTSKGHPRFVAQGDGHVRPQPVRESPTVTPEEQAALSWRQDYDRRRAEAFANGQGCGRCISGVVSFLSAVGEVVGTAKCSCNHGTSSSQDVKPESKVS